jgi:hypothetical protein
MKIIAKIINVCAFLCFCQTVFCQKPLTHITIDPLKFNKQAFNAGLQVQINAIPKVALYGSMGQESKNITNGIAMLEYQLTTQAFEARFYPFCQLKKGRSSGCEQANFYPKTRASNASILRGGYLAPGLLFEKIVFDSLSQKVSETKPNTNNLTAKTRAFTLAFGYQIQISAFTLGISYQAAFRKTSLDGNGELLKNTDFANSLQPNHSHLVHTLRTEIGIHF